MKDRDPLKLPQKAVDAALRAGDEWRRLKWGFGHPFSPKGTFDDLPDDEKELARDAARFQIRAFLREWLS